MFGMGHVYTILVVYIKSLTRLYCKIIYSLISVEESYEDRAGLFNSKMLLLLNNMLWKKIDRVL